MKKKMENIDVVLYATLFQRNFHLENVCFFTLELEHYVYF